MVVAGEREDAVVGEKWARHLTTPLPRTALCRALGEAEVVEVRGVERLEIDVNCTGDLMKTSKTQLNLRRLEQDNGLWPKTTSKTSWKDSRSTLTFRSSPASCRRWR